MKTWVKYLIICLLLALLTACNVATDNNIEQSSVISSATINNMPIEVMIPIITDFSSSTSTIMLDDIEMIDVSWTVQNRPENSNLVFEQVLADGTVRNAELPREIAYVPSSGSGMLLPIATNESDETLTFQIRLIDLTNNQTLAREQLMLTTIRSSEWTGIELNQGSCDEAPFFPSNNIQIGDEGRVQLNGRGNLDVYETLDYQTIVASLAVGEIFLIEAGPDCLYVHAQNYAMRRWFINTGSETGWVDEYFYPMPAAYSYYFIPADQTDMASVEINSLSVSPSTVNRDDIATTDFIFTWATSNTSILFFEPSLPSEAVLASDGSLVVQGRDLISLIGSGASQEFNLIALDTQSNMATLATTLIID